MSPQIRRVLNSRVFWITSIITSLAVYFLIAYFTNIEYIMNTLGPRWVLFEVIVGGLSVLLTGIFFGLSAYKISFFRVGQGAQISTQTTLGAIGSFLSFCVAGCPSCSITLISYIGLSSVLSFLPYSGTELRLVGVLIMLVSLWFLWRDLEVCALPKSRKKTA